MRVGLNQITTRDRSTQDQDNPEQDAGLESQVEKLETKSLDEVLADTAVDGEQAKLPAIAKKDTRTDKELVEALGHGSYEVRDRAMKELFDRPEAHAELLSAIPRVDGEQRERIWAVLDREAQIQIADFNVEKDFLITPFSDEQKTTLQKQLQTAVTGGRSEAATTLFQTIAAKKTEIEAMRQKIGAFAERLVEADLEIREYSSSVLSSAIDDWSDRTYPSAGLMVMSRYQKELLNGTPQSLARVEKILSIVEEVGLEDLLAAKTARPIWEAQLNWLEERPTEKLARQALRIVTADREHMSPRARKFIGDRFTRVETAIDDALKVHDATAIQNALERSDRYYGLYAQIDILRLDLDAELTADSSFTNTLKQMRSCIDSGELEDHDFLHEAVAEARYPEALPVETRPTGLTFESRLTTVLTNRLSEEEGNGNKQRVELLEKALGAAAPQKNGAAPQ